MKVTCINENKKKIYSATFDTTDVTYQNKFDGWPGKFWIKHAIELLNDTQIDIETIKCEEIFKTLEDIEKSVNSFKPPLSQTNKEHMLLYISGEFGLNRAIVLIQKNIQIKKKKE